jgi:predicted DNA-binding protein (UPF0251 family)
MASIKTKVLPTKKGVTVQEKERAALKTEANKVIKLLKDTCLKQDHIAEKMSVGSATLSRFMTGKESYITRSMVDKAKLFLDSSKTFGQ